MDPEHLAPPWRSLPRPNPAPQPRPAAPPRMLRPVAPPAIRPIMPPQPVFPPPPTPPYGGLIEWWRSQSYPALSLLVIVVSLVVGAVAVNHTHALPVSIPIPILDQVAPGIAGTSGHSEAKAPPPQWRAPSAKGAVTFRDSQSHDTGGVTTIDDDGIDPSPVGSPDHQGQTSYADGRLSALRTNYFALNPGWASAHGLVLGDVGALTYRGKTIFAVYGDNHVGDTPHAEISVASAMALTGQTDPASAENSLQGVKFAIFPGTHNQLNGSVSQHRINQIGSRA